MTENNVWTPEQGRKELEYFTNSDYGNGGIIRDSKFERRFMTLYPKRGMVGFVSRLFERGGANYYLHILKLIDDKPTGVEKEWWTIRDFMPIPKESKLGRALIGLEEQGAFDKK